MIKGFLFLISGKLAPQREKKALPFKKNCLLEMQIKTAMRCEWPLSQSLQIINLERIWVKGTLLHC